MSDQKKVGNTFNPMSLANDSCGIKESESVMVLNPFTEIDLIKDIYNTLLQDSESNFFNSWEWVSSWIENLPGNTDLKFMVHIVNAEIIACYFVGYKVFSKFKLLNKTKAYLNSTGFIEYDTLTIEYNTILVSKKYNGDLFSLMANTLNVDDIVLPVSTIKINNQDFYLSEIEHPSYWVDLDVLRNTDGDYFDCISKNKKKQIKRSLSAYKNVKIEIAKTKSEAIEMMWLLAELHQNEWESRGEKGAFSNLFFCNFHRSLIEKSFDKGMIQILKVSDDNEVIGYLYNFVFNGDVMFYQCGFNYKEGNNFRPGIISHYMAINYALNNGMKKYNFLAGKSQYKKSLSTDVDIMKSIVATKKTLKATLERKIKRILSGE